MMFIVTVCLVLDNYQLSIYPPHYYSFFFRLAYGVLGPTY